MILLRIITISRSISRLPGCLTREWSRAGNSWRLGARCRVRRCGQEMVILPGSVVWVPALSVTATVKVNVPAVVGVPDSPAGGLAASVRPGEICPEGIDQV